MNTCHKGIPGGLTDRENSSHRQKIEGKNCQTAAMCHTLHPRIPAAQMKENYSLALFVFTQDSTPIRIYG